MKREVNLGHLRLYLRRGESDVVIVVVAFQVGAHLSQWRVRCRELPVHELPVHGLPVHGLGGAVSRGL